MGVNYSLRLERAKYLFLQTNQNDENKIKIIEFIDHLIANDQSPARQLKYFYTLKTIYKNFNKTFTQANKKEIEEFVSWINNSKYEYWTKRDFKIILKKFYKWLREEEGHIYCKYEYPDEVKWINTGKKQNKKKLPQELLTIEDIKKLAENTNNLRDRAIILLLYESGGRIGEILNTRIKDLENDKYGSLITLSGKTGQRKILIIASSPAINNWLLEHPDRQSKNAFIFCGIWGKKRGEEIGYNTINKLLKKEVTQLERRCPDCDRIVPFDANICPYCASKFYKFQSNEVKAKCDSCGYEIQSNDNFCRNCGKKI